MRASCSADLLTLHGVDVSRRVASAAALVCLASDVDARPDKPGINDAPTETWKRRMIGHKG
jgi:hypothetical protein